MRTIKLIILIVVLSTSLLCPSAARAAVASVTASGRYYTVDLTVPDGEDAHFELGKAYGQAIVRAVPNFETLADGYINHLANMAGPVLAPLAYRLMLKRAAHVKQQIPLEYQQEIDGIASTLSGFNGPSRLGDGKISADELELFNTMPDVCRISQCCAAAFYGSSSADGKTIVGRNLDWTDGSEAMHEMLQLHAVVHIHDHGKELITLGFLGVQGCITGVNEDGLFTAILDSGTGAPYDARNKRSFYMDLRKQMEVQQLIEPLSARMMMLAPQNAFNHLIFAADAHRAFVIEDNFSGPTILSTKKYSPAPRYWNSTLHDGIVWNHADAVATVNSFLLKSHFDNQTAAIRVRGSERGAFDFRNESGAAHNVKRWETMTSRVAVLLQDSGKVDSEGLKRLMTANVTGWPGNPDCGDLMNKDTMQSVIYQPDTRRLQVYFRRLGDASATYEDVPTFSGHP
jgi:hypothetical protein